MAAGYGGFRLDELKLVYRALHAHLLEHEELMDTEFFGGLQDYLQSLAKSAGVDLSDHAAWASWLAAPSTPTKPGRLTLV